VKVFVGVLLGLAAFEGIKLVAANKKIITSENMATVR